mmetsp:Transcript_38665/g.76103  ORF Transcript_38665/g.76103 Transcript_38665/m.76103 type:complete len:1885 (-) Transcript_38665:85-5739(-)
MSKDKRDGVPDLCQLSNLSEPSILQNLSVRYKQQKIYTSTTAKVLVAVNPYERVPESDTEATLAKYQRAPVNLEGLLTANNLEPHVFTVAHAAYHNMAAKKENQSVVVCGESGSGKTESAKLFMKFLAYTSTVTSEDQREYQEAEKIGKQVLDANPILESFGNAKTVLNNNSSRFGKFTKMMFAEREGKAASCKLVGAIIETYLLEKSRVVRQDAGERNYHVFYYICTQAAKHPEWKLGTGNPENFHYLNQSGVTTLDGDSKTDEDDFAVLSEAMETLKISKSEQQQVFSIVAAILHLGNIEFTEDPSNHEASAIVDHGPLQTTADLLGVDANKLKHRLLIRSIKAQGQMIEKPLDRSSAMENRDSIAKALFNGVFLWVVKRINEESMKVQSSTLSWIGTLDVFGFEIFESNSFEQFCINFCNERLQQFFNFHVLKSEQDLYRREALLWTPIDLPENQDTIDLIMGKSGIFKILDSACLQPRGTHADFTHNVFQAHKYHPRLEQQKFASPCKKRRGQQLTKMNGFTIQHYAGSVVYDAKEFLFKNKDTTHPDTLQLFVGSTSPVTAQVLLTGPTGPASTGTLARRGSMQFNSVSNVFSKQLESLMQTLTATTPYFIRCIKPNTHKSPRSFDAEYVHPQLTYGGLLEALKIIKTGFPTRCSYERITEQFRTILHDFRTVTNLNKRDFSEAIVMICSKEALDKSTYQLGLSMIFFKPGKQDAFRKILELSPAEITTEQRLKIHKFLIHKRIVRMRGSVRAGIRLRHLFIFRRIQRAASVYTIIYKTMFKSLRRARRRLGIKSEAEEAERLARDQKYQAALAAAEQLKVLQSKEAQWKAKMEVMKADQASNTASHKRELESMNAQLDTLHSKIKDLTQQVLKLQDVSKQKEAETILLKNQLQQAQNDTSQLDAFATEKAAEIEEILAEKQRVEVKLSQVEADLTSCNQEFASKEAEATEERRLAKQNNTRQESEIAALESRVKQLTSQNQSTASQFQSAEADLKAGQQRLQDLLDDKISELRRFKSENQNTISILEGQAASSDKEVQRLKEKIERLQQDAENQREESEEVALNEKRAATDKQKVLNEQLKNKDFKLNQLSTQLALLQSQYESLQQQLKTQVQANGDLQQKMARECSKLNEELHATKQQGQKSLDASKAKLEIEKQHKIDAQDKLQEALLICQKLENDIRRTAEQNSFDKDAWKKKLDSKELELDSMVQEKLRLAASLDESSLQLQQADIKTKQTIADLNAEIANLQEKCYKTQSDADEKLSKTQKGLRQEAEDAGAKLKEQIAELKAALATATEGKLTATSEKESTTLKLQQRELEIADLQRKMEETESFAEDVELRLQRANVQVEEMHKKSAEKEDNHENDLHSLKSKLQGATSQLKLVLSEVHDLREENNSLNEDIYNTKEKYEKDLCEVTRELELTKHQLQTAELAHQQQTQQLESQLAASKSTLAGMDNSFQLELQATAEQNSQALKTQKQKFQAELKKWTEQAHTTKKKHMAELKQTVVAHETANRKLSAAKSDAERQLQSTKEQLQAYQQLVNQKEKTMTEIQHVFETELESQKDNVRRLTKKLESLKQDSEEAIAIATSEHRSTILSLRKELKQAQVKFESERFNCVRFKKEIDCLSRQVSVVKAKALNDSVALEDQFKREFSIKASRLGRKCDAQAKENERLQEEINLLQEEHAKELDAVRQRYQTMSEQSNNQLIMEQQASLSEGAYIKDAFSQLQVQKASWEAQQTNYEDKIQDMVEEIARLKRDHIQEKEALCCTKAEANIAVDSLTTQLTISRMQAVNLQKNMQQSQDASVSVMESEIKMLKSRLAAYEGSSIVMTYTPRFAAGSSSADENVETLNLSVTSESDSPRKSTKPASNPGTPSVLNIR